MGKKPKKGSKACENKSRGTKAGLMLDISRLIVALIRLVIELLPFG
ncbi:hypothetical protein [Glutamicibacter uratoxydans]